MARTPTTLLDGQILTAYSSSNTFSCSLAANSTGSLLFKSSISHIFTANNGIQWAVFSTQSLFSPTASASVWGVDCITSGSLAGNLVFRAAISGLSNGFTVTQDGTSNIIYTFNDGILVCGGTAGTTSGVISAGTGFRINDAAAAGNVLRGDGTNFVSAALDESDINNLSTDLLSITSDISTIFSDISSINSSLATKVSSVVGISDGGTGSTSYTTNRIIYYNGTNFASSIQSSGWSIGADVGKILPGTISTTGPTNVAPYGFTTAAQFNDLIAALNTLINNMFSLVGALQDAKILTN